jgi:hypothetical protein
MLSTQATTASAIRAKIFFQIDFVVPTDDTRLPVDRAATSVHRRFLGSAWDKPMLACSTTIRGHSARGLCKIAHFGDHSAAAP